MFAEVFKEGSRLKQENDLTIYGIYPTNFPKLVNAVKEKGIKGTEVGFPVPWGIKGYFNAYLHEADDGPLKGKKLLRIFLNESFPNPGW